MCVFCELLEAGVEPDLEAIERLDLEGNKYNPPILLMDGNAT